MKTTGFEILHLIQSIGNEIEHKTGKYWNMENGYQPITTLKLSEF